MMLRSRRIKRLLWVLWIVLPSTIPPTLSSAVLSGMTRAMRNLILLFISVCRLHSTPMTPSASQWPNPLLSTASGGRSEMGTRPGIGKRDVLLPPRLRRRLCPRGRYLAPGSWIPWHGAGVPYGSRDKRRADDMFPFHS